jgi:hypothetical protein
MDLIYLFLINTFFDFFFTKITLNLPNQPCLSVHRNSSHGINIPIFDQKVFYFFNFGKILFTIF